MCESFDKNAAMVECNTAIQHYLECQALHVYDPDFVRIVVSDLTDLMLFLLQYNPENYE
jgi:hypothetical protein